MALINIDSGLDKETLAMLKEVKAFTSGLMRASGIEMDRIETAKDAISSQSPLQEVFKAYRKIDLHLLGIPAEKGGMGDLGWQASLLINELMGHGDPGLAMSLWASDAPFSLASRFKSPWMDELVNKYCSDRNCKMIGCWAVNEPSRSSGRCNLGAWSGVKASLKKDKYILNGAIHDAYNAGFANFAAVSLDIGSPKKIAGPGLGIIPLDVKGVTKREPVNRMGLRTLNQGDIIFDNARIPRECVIDSGGKTLAGKLEDFLGRAELQAGAVYAGLSLAAFEEAVKYSKERIQGGVPIFEHKNIKLVLFRMFTAMEAARANVRRLASHDSSGSEGPSRMHSIAAKSLSTETAAEVASDAIQVFGGNGLAKEYPLEKMFRDARAGLVEHGVNDSMALMAAEDF